MNLLLKLGWRNIWRNGRRSVITILAVMFAVMLSIVMRGVQLGTYAVNIRHVVQLFSGHLQIQAPGFQENPSLQKSFHPGEQLLQELAEDERIAAFTMRVSGDGLVSLGETSVGASILGVDPATEVHTSTLGSRIERGRFLESSDRMEIVVGRTLLSNLNAGIGDEVVVLAQGFDGSLGNWKYRIVGTLKTGSPEFDRGAVVMGLAAAQDLFGMYGRVNSISLLLHDMEEIDEVRHGLSQDVTASGLGVLDWKEIMPDFAQSIQLDNISGILMLSILIIVVALGITNTVLMSITERFREFGVIIAIGMKQRRLAAVVILETFFIVLIGIALGDLFGAGINYYLILNPIEFVGEFGAIYEEYGFLPRIESTMEAGLFIRTSAAILLISLIASMYPVSKVFRMEPLKGIRYT